jgi:predicted membrane channel-forming protein YqfA (hemolysin III family)
MFEKIAVLLTSDYQVVTMFDHVNLRGLHYTASLLGAIMALYVMQLWTVGALAVATDCWLGRHARRFSLLFIALAMLWSLNYQDVKGWDPWPSDVFLSCAVDLFLLSSILVAFKKRRMTG